MKMSSLIPLAPRIFDLFDNNHDGTVDMREILCGFSSLRNSQGDDALRLCFQVRDLSSPEKPATFFQLIITSRIEIDNLNADSKLSFFHSQMYDTDGSGCISKDEVASMLRVNYLSFWFY